MHISLVSKKGLRPLQQGFTLVEVVLVILVLSLASVLVLGQFSAASKAWWVDEDLQVATQLAQERAEIVLAGRRNGSYTSIAPGTVNDTLTGTFAVYTRTVAVTTLSASPCPVASCKQVVVTVGRGGTDLATVTFMLVDY